MAYNRFLWYTNVRKNTLPTSSPLLLRIRNGDFELSPYLIEADEQRDLAKKIYDEEMNNPRISNYLDRQDEARHKTRMKQVKALKLSEEGNKDEIRRLNLLRKALHKEFGADLWDRAVDVMNDGSVEDLYFWYKSELDIGFTKSEMDISLGRHNK